jgi:hypothetical protein
MSWCDQLFEFLNTQERVAISVVPAHQAEDLVLSHPEPLLPQKSVDVFQGNEHLALTALLLDASEQIEHLEIELLR